MSNLDLIVLFGTLGFIVAYGSLKARGNRNIKGYLLGDNSMKWGTIGLSVMATQASAITFISTPGMAYERGLEFVQNYLGLPIALIIVSAVFIPMFYRLKVFTAYEYLESRFDLKTRLLGAIIFFIQRGLAAGITIYAPAIIISSVLGWDLNWTIILAGGLVIIYTVTGGTKAVSITQKQQMAVILVGMVAAFVIVINKLPADVSFGDAIQTAGAMGKLNAIDFSFDFEKRYTFWSGIAGGLFLSLSYFGTDQSQVQRYISGQNTTESRMGLMFNAVLKIPMQFFILLVGVMVFVFYLYEPHPVHFNRSNVEFLENSEAADRYEALSDQYAVAQQKREKAMKWLNLGFDKDEPEPIRIAQDRIQEAEAEMQSIRSETKQLITELDPDRDTKDSDYVFLSFILAYLPHGMIGLLIAVIFSAAMSSISSELNALGSTSTVDIYKRVWNKEASDEHYLRASKLLTAFWGVMAIGFALTADLVENLIEFINILGSLFYGTVLGIFLVAFFFKYIRGTAVFIAGVAAQVLVLLCHLATVMGYIKVSYLLYNLIGCALVIILGFIAQVALSKRTS